MSDLPRSFAHQQLSPEAAFSAYTKAAQAKMGPLGPGQYGMVGGKLIKRLDELDFADKYREFIDLDAIYHSLVASGATIDELLYKELTGLAEELMMNDLGGRFAW
ncbi:MAG: hypothetical protein RBU37_16940 [Myxococcota bacterium]|nr:hypothetical protein [Myxococcota bacterium]